MGVTLLTVVPLMLLGGATAVFRFTNADTAISAPYYEGPILGWPLKYAQPWKGLYDAGCWPAWLIGAGGLVAVLASFLWSRLRPCRGPALFLALMLVIGPGLLVNLVLKDHWGRPRPVQTKVFDGEYDFLPIGDLGSNRRECRSFPSGHASMGFYLMAPAFLLYRRRPRLAAAFLVLGLTYGGVMGFARIVQGRHFASDVIWSAAVIYFTGVIMALVHHRLADSASEEAPHAGTVKPGDRRQTSLSGADHKDLQRAA